MGFLIGIILICRFVSYLANKDDKKIIRYRQLDHIRDKIEKNISSG